MLLLLGVDYISSYMSIRSRQFLNSPIVLRSQLFKIKPLGLNLALKLHPRNQGI